ncbi:MAG: ATP-dependent zinc protease [Chloroflexi bacterium]|nr:MAG: ATP-dependent zinc protease [Chloroflexota bacterium]
MVKRRNTNLPIIGWREWVGLPDFGIKAIKVKVDTGARSSSLHAYGMEVFERDGAQWVRFQIQPIQRKSNKTEQLEVKVLEFRSVRSSSGRAAIRPVIIANVELLGITWPVELTLARRTKMGFRMLLGREAIRRRFFVDTGNSYYGGKPKRTKRPKQTQTAAESATEGI